MSGEVERLRARLRRLQQAKAQQELIFLLMEALVGVEGLTETVDVALGAVMETIGGVNVIFYYQAPDGGRWRRRDILEQESVELDTLEDPVARAAIERGALVEAREPGEPPQPKSWAFPLQAKGWRFGCLKLEGMLADYAPTIRQQLGVFIDYLSLRLHHELTVERRLSAAYASLQARHDELRRQVAERERLEEQLRHAQKMKAIGTLAGGIAHDFNNMLAGILGFAELLTLEIEPGGDAEECVDQILSAAKRARELVQQILTFSRKEEVTRAPLDPHGVVREALGLLRKTIPSSVSFQLALEPCAPVLADATQLHQIVLNLCTNAAHAMRASGGRLYVSLAPTRVDEARAAALEITAGSFVQLSVRDEGVGMAPEVLERVFEPFFTTKGRDEGTGMGLSVVHGIVHAYGGAITAESAPGRGSLFMVLLPCAPLGEAEERAASEAIEGAAQGRVLLVDDEPTLVALGQRQLERLGYEVRGFTHPREALTAFYADPHGVDLLVTDQTMPGLTGAELTSIMRASRPELAVIICTGYSDTLDEARARALGAHALLRKPFEGAALAHAARGALTARGAP